MNQNNTAVKLLLPTYEIQVGRPPSEIVMVVELDEFISVMRKTLAAFQAFNDVADRCAGIKAIGLGLTIKYYSSRYIYWNKLQVVTDDDIGELWGPLVDAYPVCHINKLLEFRLTDSFYNVSTYQLTLDRLEQIAVEHKSRD